MKKMILFVFLGLITKFSFSQVNTSSETWKSIGNPDCIELNYETSFIEKVTENGCTKNKYKVTITLKNNSNKDLKAEKVFLNFFYSDNCMDPNSTDALFMQRAICNENDMLISPGQIQTGTSNVFLPIDKKPEEYDPQWEILIKAKGGAKGLNYNKGVNANFLQKNTATGTFTDYRDGHEYKTIKIGNQIWMSENLAFKPQKGKYWAYDKNPNNIAKYGYLYDWNTALNACPVGWHLPSKDEFVILLKMVGDHEKVSFYLLAPDGYSGFSAVYGGVRTSYRGGDFYNIDGKADFWSGSPYQGKTAWHLHLLKHFETASFSGYDGLRDTGMSVRCVKDN